MDIYAAFDSDGVSVLISDADLNDAAAGSAPLTAELADAAAQARRTDLIDNLRASLGGDDRSRKLAAAKALLALDDRTAGALLESLADTETDTVVAKSFRAVATRLRGAQAAAELFTDPQTDPQLARLLVSNYNSHLRPATGDIRFLVLALGHYVDRSLPWLTTLRANLWDNGVYLILVALSSDNAVSLLRDERCAPERARLLLLLSPLTDHPGDDDIAADARSLRAVLSAD